MRLLSYELFDDNGRVLVKETTSFVTALEWKNSNSKHTMKIKFSEYKEASTKEEDKEKKAKEKK